MLLLNAVIATMESNKPYGLIERGALVLKGSKIAWVGDQNDLPKELTGDRFLVKSGQVSKITKSMDLK